MQLLFGDDLCLLRKTSLSWFASSHLAGCSKSLPSPSTVLREIKYFYICSFNWQGFINKTSEELMRREAVWEDKHVRQCVAQLVTAMFCRSRQWWRRRSSWCSYSTKSASIMSRWMNASFTADAGMHVLHLNTCAFCIVGGPGKRLQSRLTIVNFPKRHYHPLCPRKTKWTWCFVD